MGPASDTECGPVTDAEVRIHADGYSVVLRSGARAWHEREGRNIRHWPRLEQALSYVVSRYGVHSVRLRLRENLPPSSRRSF